MNVCPRGGGKEKLFLECNFFLGPGGKWVEDFGMGDVYVANLLGVGAGEAN